MYCDHNTNPQFLCEHKTKLCCCVQEMCKGKYARYLRNRAKDNRRQTKTLSHDLFILETSERNKIINAKTSEFSIIIQKRDAIPEIFIPENIIREKKLTVIMNQLSRPIRSLQTRRRNKIYQEYLYDFRRTFHEMEKQERQEIAKQENSTFLKFLEEKTILPNIVQIETRTRRRRSLFKRDKFFFDVLTCIGCFVKVGDILSFMTVFKLEDDFPPYITMCKLRGFLRPVKMKQFEQYITTEPTKQITQSTVYSTYKLNKKDMLHEDYEEVTNPHYRCAAPMKLYYEQRIIVMSHNKYGEINGKTSAKEDKKIWMKTPIR